MIWTRDNIHSALPYQQTQPDWVYANAQFAYEDRAVGYNVAGIKDYMNSFQQYAAARNEHPELAASFKPPVPPFKWIVETNPGGWPELKQSTELVIQPMIYTPPEKGDLAEGLIGTRMYPGNDEYFYSLPNDITPNWKIIEGTSADGVTGKFQKYANIQSSPGAHGIPGVFIKVG